METRKHGQRLNQVDLILRPPHVEPEQGQYDYHYLDRIEDLVDLYNSNGMTVLLDMHQDLYGPGITESRDVGNGAPVWATYTDGLPVREQPDWSLYYLQPGVIRAFDNFWNKRGNHPELMESYAKMWQIVAGRFSQHPGVFGYDLMNEPFGGSYLPNVLESGALAKLYAMTIERIREVDNDTWIFVEPVALGGNHGFATRLPYLPDPRDGNPKIGYAPHLYILGTEEGGMSAIVAPGVKTGIKLWQSQVRKQAQTLSPDGTTVPILVGEYGANSERRGAVDYLRLAREAFAEMGASTFFYSSDPDAWSPWDEEGNHRPVYHELKQCHPIAVPGLVAKHTSSSVGCELLLAPGSNGLAHIQVPQVEDVSQINVEGGEIINFDAVDQVLTVAVERQTFIRVTVN